MRIVAFIIAVLLVLSGGGCVVTWLANQPRMSGEFLLIVGGFGVLPLIGGALLFAYAWRDRKSGG